MDTDIKSRYYRFIFEKSTDAIFLTSPDGYIFRANAAACNLFQKSEFEIRQQGYQGIFDLSDPRLAPAFKKRSLNGQINAELTFVRSDGSTFIGDCTSTAITDENGNEWTVTIVRNTSDEYVESEEQSFEQVAGREKYDALTGVITRKTFLEKLSQEMNRSCRERIPMSLVLLGIDDFKSVNNQYGYLFGNYALRKLALFLSVSIRSYDVLSRFGGDEFIICLPFTENDAALHVADNLTKKIKVLEIENSGISTVLSASAGVATYNPISADTVDLLISRVTQNLFKAKSRAGVAAV